MMKGIKLERATPGNILDIYGLLKGANKEGKLMKPAPSDQAIGQYYFELLDLLADLTHNHFFIARRQRMILGYVQLRVNFRKLGPSPIVMVSNLYVIPKKRKLGVGRALFKHGIDELKKAGIGRFEFLCEDDLVPYYEKIAGAKKTLNFMVVE